MVRREDSKPLALAAVAPASPEDPSWMLTKKQRRRRRCILCCSCCVSTTVIIGIIILILALTVFKVKDPRITMNSIVIDRLNIDTSSTSSSAVNMSATANISVKNPNAATFKFGNSTTEVVYRGETVGVATMPAGKAKAKRTMRANVTVVVLASRLVGDGNLLTDLIAGTLPLSTHTKLGGRVHILNVFKKHVDVVMNCNITVSVATQSILDQKCEKKVKL